MPSKHSPFKAMKVFYARRICLVEGRNSTALIGLHPRTSPSSCAILSPQRSPIRCALNSEVIRKRSFGARPINWISSLRLNFPFRRNSEDWGKQRSQSLSIKRSKRSERAMSWKNFGKDVMN